MKFFSICGFFLVLTAVFGCPKRCGINEICIRYKCVTFGGGYCIKNYECALIERCINQTCVLKPASYCDRDEDCGDHFYCEEKNTCKKPVFPYRKFYDCLRKKSVAREDDPVMLKAC